MESNKRKKYIHIDRETGSNQIYAMLDEIESNTKSDIENLLEDSDVEYISEEIYIFFQIIRKKAIVF